MTDVVPYLDLAAQYGSIKGEILTAVNRILDTNQYILGDEVKAFEAAFATAHEGADAVAVNSGTSALHLALVAAGVGPGDEVVTTSFTFIATVAAIGYTGATPVFVDIEPDTYTIDPARIEAAVTPRTKAILPDRDLAGRVLGKVADEIRAPVPEAEDADANHVCGPFPRAVRRSPIIDCG
jgi:dTDP-4-amino-4,6-dideoxygalactose transaminase